LGTNKRYSGKRDLAEPYGATTMGLIYVNPEGPEGKPDPIAAAVDIRETFARMAMNDEETAALIVGGHSFGKTHGAGDADLVGPEPEAARSNNRAGWKSPYGSGKGKDATPAAWRCLGLDPTKWGNGFLQNLYGYEWELTKSPAEPGSSGQGRGRWGTIPDPFGGPGRAPTMLVTDISLREDPIYREITRRWLDHPERWPRSSQGVVQAVAPRHGDRYRATWGRGSGAAAVAGPGSGVDHSWSTKRRCGPEEQGARGRPVRSQLVKTAWSRRRATAEPTSGRRERRKASP